MLASWLEGEGEDEDGDGDDEEGEGLAESGRGCIIDDGDLGARAEEGLVPSSDPD